MINLMMNILMLLQSLDLPLIVVIGLLILFVVIGILAFRRNYIIQVKVSLLMDSECSVYNKNGLGVYLKKTSGIKKPTLVVVNIENLGQLYTAYRNKSYLLYTIASQLLKDLQPLDNAGRVDFDRFLVVFNGRSSAEIKNEIAKIEERLKKLELKDYGKYNYHLTFGVYENADISDPQDAIERTIAVPTYSKVKFNHIYYYTEEVNTVVQRLEHMNEMKDHALMSNQFDLYMIPKISFTEGRVVGGEIHPKWVDSSGIVLYQPEEFIPLFEQNGFISQLNAYLFERVCETLKNYAYRGFSHIILSLEFSKASFDNVNFIDHIGMILQKHSINPRNIEIEVKETSLKHHFVSLSNSIHRLRALGLRVAVSNFGKENMSISSLLENAVDTVKIDRFFFGTNLHSERDRGIVTNMIHLLEKIRCTIVCDGIDNQATVDQLAMISANLIIQGKYVSQPIDLGKFEDYMTSASFQFAYSAPELEAEKAMYASKNEVVPVKQNNEIEALKKQIEELKRLNEKNSEKSDRDLELEHLRFQNEQLKNIHHGNKGDYGYQEKSAKDIDIELLRLQIEQLKNNQNSGRSDFRDQEIESLRREINEMKRVKDDLSKTKEAVDDSHALKEEIERNRVATENLKEKLEKERKEREELEDFVNDILSKKANETPASAVDEDIYDAEIIADDDDEDDDEEAVSDSKESEKIDRPILPLPIIEAIVASLRDKYSEDWEEHTQEDLKDTYDDFAFSLEYYRIKLRKNLADKLLMASDELKQLYNDTKNEIMKFGDVTNKVTNKYDIFYIGKNQIAKMAITKTRIKIFLALKPENYQVSQFPHRNVSEKKAHSKTPFLMMIKSSLSQKRFSNLLSEIMLDHKCIENPQYKSSNYINDMNNYKTQNIIF